jgi:predicted RND superfamily exporter protein
MSDRQVTRLEQPGHPGFEAWGHLMVRFRVLVVLITFAAIAGFGYLAKEGIVMDTSVEAFAKSDSETQKVLKEYRHEFGRDTMFVVLINGDVFSMPYLETLRRLHEELKRLDIPLESIAEKTPAAPATKAMVKPKSETDDDFGDFGSDFEDSSDAWGEEKGSIVEQITSLINVRRTRRKGSGGLDVGELLSPFPRASALPALKKEVLNDATLVGQVIDKQGKYSAISIRTFHLSQADSERVFNKIKLIAKSYETTGFKVQVGGLPALNAALNGLMMGDLQTMFRWSLGIMFLVLLYLFRHPLGIFAPLIVVFASSIITVGILAIMGIRLTMLSNILPAFLFCVGIGHSVHLISAYRDAMADGLGSTDAVIRALSITGVPIFYTSLTTMLGLLSFHFASLEAIQEMGYAGAFAVLLAFVLSITFLPAAISFNQKGRFGLTPGKQDFLDRFLALCLRASGEDDDSGMGSESQLARKRRIRNLLVMCMLLGVGGVGASQLRLWHNPLDWIPDDAEIKQAFSELDEHLGGTANVQILIDGTPQKGIKDRTVLQGIEKLQAHIVAYEDPVVGNLVGNALSVVDIVKESHKVMLEDRPQDYRLPDTDRGVSDMLFMFENSGREQLRRMVTSDCTRTQMTIRMKWLEATAYFGLTAYIDEGIKKYIPEGARARPTGSVYTLVTTIGQMIHDLLASFGVAFVLITLTMMFLLRSLKLGLIAMVPNLMPIVLIMGIMGVVGIPIDMNTLLIASIAMGLAVDDTIHLLHHFRVNYEHTGNREDALRDAVNHSGRAMISTTLILMLGFLTYMSASMANIVRFGFLVGMTALLALLIDLFFAPALIRTFYSRTRDTEDLTNA